LASEGPVLLEGPGSSHDAALVRGLVTQAVDAELDDFHPTRNFTGEVRFTITARFAGGRLVFTDAALVKSRRRLWRED
jgi:hypothetical protein